MSQKKILYIVAHRLGRSPGQRFRFEQYLDFLKLNGFDYEISNFLNETDDKLFYSKGKYLQKFMILLKSIRQRFNDVKRASEFDIVFIYRDAIMIGSAWFEKQFKRSSAKTIFDFDDAIWFPETSDGNSNLQWLKRPSKVKTIIRLSDIVFAGNAYLADFARNFNNNVKIVPTTIDTNYYIRKNVPKPKDKICIGWTGSSTTLKHFQRALPFLKRINERYRNRVYFKIISDVPYHTDELDIEFVKWNKESEIDDLSYFDIGIMPLPDDKWSKGKCGFKGLQYMALQIPAVMSPVGVNNEIITNGVNGFLPDTNEDWIDTLSVLIESKKLRETIGTEGRKTVIEKYSFYSQKEIYLSYFNELIPKNNTNFEY